MDQSNSDGTCDLVWLPLNVEGGAGLEHLAWSWGGDRVEARSLGDNRGGSSQKCDERELHNERVGGGTV